MSRHGAHPQLALLVTLAATVAIAFLPHHLRFGWQSDLARIVHVPMRPLTHPLNLVRGWLRPAARHPELEGVPAGAEQVVGRLLEERDVAQRGERAAMQRVRELEEQLAELQRLPAEVFRTARTPVIAHVVRVATAGPLPGVVEVAVPRRAESIIQPGSIAVTGGVHLLGRAEAGAVGGRCRLIPVVHPASGFILARVAPADRPEIGIALQLEPMGVAGFRSAAGGDAQEIGGFAGDIERRAGVAIGDVVRLEDPAWPATAQQMILGRVVAIEDKRDQPLRQRAIIRPFWNLAEMAYVTLITETEVERTP